MARKKAESFVEPSVEAVEEKISPLQADFTHADLNLLKEKINEIITQLNK